VTDTRFTGNVSDKSPARLGDTRTGQTDLADPSQLTNSATFLPNGPYCSHSITQMQLDKLGEDKSCKCLAWIVFRGFNNEDDAEGPGRPRWWHKMQGRSSENGVFKEWMKKHLQSG